MYQKGSLGTFAIETTLAREHSEVGLLRDYQRSVLLHASLDKNRGFYALAEGDAFMPERSSSATFELRYLAYRSVLPQRLQAPRLHMRACLLACHLYSAYSQATYLRGDHARE